MVFQGYLFAILYGLLCLGLSAAAYKLGMPKKYTRKLVHILVGFEWVILYAFFGSQGQKYAVHTLIVCIAFTLLLALMYFKKLSPMIESDADNAPGTVYYGVAMTVMATVCMFVPNFFLFFGIGVFATSLGDGFAGLVGQMVKKYNPKIYGGKSLLGFLVNFLISSLVPLAFKFIFTMQLSIWHCFYIGLFAAMVELISSHGLDNITVTLGAAFLSYAIVYLPTYMFYIVPIIATPLIIALVLKKRALTPAATLLAVVLDAVVSLAFGNFGFVLLLTFLAGSVLIDKIKKKKLSDDGISKRGDCRDSIQVIANGLIPMLMAIFYAASLNDVFIVAYIAVLAEAFADTAASGLGVFSDSAFDVFKWKKCEKGISGGMSAPGTVAAFGVSFVIPLMGWAFGMIDWRMFLVASLAAFFGTLVDSMLGSLVQVKYKCRVCGKLTERNAHCQRYTEKVSGFEFFDNDVVNLFSGISAAILAAVISAVIM